MSIVVTGGASGVGEALVARQSDREVWVLDVKPPSALADSHHFLSLDIANPSAIDRVVSSLPDQIDGLANVAGIAQATEPETVLAVNFLGLRHLTDALTPRLKPGGRVVHVSSVAGRDWQARYDRLMPLLETASFDEGMAWCRAHRDIVARDPYTLSKRLLTAHTLRSAQAALSHDHTVNCVSPGPIETPLYPQFESLMGKAQSEWMKAQAGRAASPADIAAVLDMLLSADCGWLNGVDVPVDGGYTAGMESGWVDFGASPIMQQRKT